MPFPVLASAVVRLLPLAVALALAGAAPAYAQQAEEPTAFQRMMGAIGLLDLPDQDPIDYRERAPLVVPPSNALIIPREYDDIAKINPDWPVDHDQLSARRRNSSAAKEKQRKADEVFYSGRPLSPEEMRRGSISKEEASKRPENNVAGEELARGKERHTPNQLGFKGWFNKTEPSVVFAGEPERTRLTQPPPGYLTPSANAPYGVVEQKREDHKAQSLYDRQGVQQNK